MHGPVLSPNGAGKILAGQRQVLAGLLRAGSAPKAEPCQFLRGQLGHADNDRP
jgi:hypothetical protein